MNIRDVPFAKHVGIETGANNTLKLNTTKNVLNHVKSIHGAAQFTLAETQSGFYLRSLFPELEGKVIPLLRASTVKYKHPATKVIYAIASVDDETKDKFKRQFLKKGRASITINVKLKDLDDVVTMAGEFTWYVQKLASKDSVSKFSLDFQ